MNRNADSRERKDWKWFSDRRDGSRWTISTIENAMSPPMKPRKMYAILRFSAKVCTESMSPERVRKVAKIVRRKVTTTRHMFHTFNMPRVSWICIECRKAVAVSQGSSDAFSTGSQNQYPPHPSSTYAHLIPKMIPLVRKNQLSRIQRRVTAIQRESSRLVRRAETAKAKGMAKAVKPR